MWVRISFADLNQFIDSISAEGLVIPNQVVQPFQLLQNTAGYTLGSGGSFATTGGKRAQKVTAWRAYYAGLLQSGGRVHHVLNLGAGVQSSASARRVAPSGPPTAHNANSWSVAENALSAEVAGLSTADFSR